MELFNVYRTYWGGYGFIKFIPLYFFWQTMDAAFVNAMTIIRYISTILTCYFAPVEPYVIKMPVTEDKEALLTFIGLQFQALLELGVNIDLIRFAQFFENANAPG